MMSQHTPRPVVMFAADGAPETIREATRAGRLRLCGGRHSAEKIEAIVERRHRALRRLPGLRGQLAEANLKLVERKLVERAKGMLMKSAQPRRGGGLRRCCARRRWTASIRLAEVAQRIVDAADLLGA